MHFSDFFKAVRRTIRRAFRPSIAFLAAVSLLLSLPFALCSCGRDESGKEYACFALFREIAIKTNVSLPKYSRLTVDTTGLPLSDEEQEALWELFEEFAKENEIHVYRCTLNEASKEGYVQWNNAGYSFLNGCQFVFGCGEEEEDGSLRFDVTYFWKSTYECYGAAKIRMETEGQKWIFTEYNDWTGMMNP